MDSSLRKLGVIGVGAALALGAASVPASAAQTGQNSPAPAPKGQNSPSGPQKLFIKEPAHATPAMLQTVSPRAKSSLLNIRGQQVAVTPAQMAAYQDLPPEVQRRLGAPVAGKVLTAAELKKVGKEYSTVMCPW